MFLYTRPNLPPPAPAIVQELEADFYQHAQNLNEIMQGIGESIAKTLDRTRQEEAETALDVTDAPEISGDPPEGYEDVDIDESEELSEGEDSSAQPSAENKIGEHVASQAQYSPVSEFLEVSPDQGQGQ